MGVDLLDFFRGKISLRRMVVLTSQLSRESLVIEELLRREHGDVTLWDASEYMLADVIDELRLLNYFQQWELQRGTKNPTAPKKPIPAYRPGKTKEDEAPAGEPEFSSEEEVQAFLQAFQPNAPIL